MAGAKRKGTVNVVASKKPRQTRTGIEEKKEEKQEEKKEEKKEQKKEEKKEKKRKSAVSTATTSSSSASSTSTPSTSTAATGSSSTAVRSQPFDRTKVKIVKNATDTVFMAIQFFDDLQAYAGLYNKAVTQRGVADNGVWAELIDEEWQVQRSTLWHPSQTRVCYVFSTFLFRWIVVCVCYVCGICENRVWYVLWFVFCYVVWFVSVT
jgi:cobalamin biosynthesis Mg chelatase CobN